MKIEVKLNKKNVLIALFAVLVIVGAVGVIAFNLAGIGGNPAQFGHSVDEMDWSKPIPADVSISGNLNVVKVAALNGGLVIEKRNSDPVNPETGRIWLRE
jgi:HAMP domain-containing protein